MPKITAIKQQQRDKERYSIYVDKEYGFSLHANQLLDAKLRVGMDIDQADIERLKKQSEDGKLLARAYDKLARRLHSEKEMRDYLKRKTDDTELVDYIIAKLYDLNLLNDYAFARQWVVNRRTLKHRSTRALRFELMQKGLGKNVIADALGDEAGQADKQALRRLAERKSRQARYKDPDKLMRYLMGKGFNYQEVKEVIRSQSD